MTKKIRTILLRNWDPAQVCDDSGLSDEYDDYIPDILSLIENRSSYEALYSHVVGLEEYFGRLRLSEEKRGETAKALYNIESSA